MASLTGPLLPVPPHQDPEGKSAPRSRRTRLASPRHRPPKALCPAAGAYGEQKTRRALSPPSTRAYEDDCQSEGRGEGLHWKQ